MVFASLVFLCIFLPINIILYFLTDSQTFRNWLLVVASMLFYAWGEPIWVVLLLFSSIVDYANGLWIERFRGTGWDKLAVVSTLVTNLGLLAIFKYNVFLYETVNAVTGLGLEVPAGFALPIGISFYSFQTLSYTIDVYRGEVPAQRSFLKFLMFVSLYFQLVAGPIVRYATIAEDIENRRTTRRDISQGILRFCIGLFKKVCIANIAATFVAQYMGTDKEPVDFNTLSFGEAWFGLAMYSVQIYFDFSGYSDMAIGLARMFGFNFLENFNYPYISRSATEFWRRWHISLGTFFRDYVYIPLGGNKRRQYLNLFIVWALTGLWHGASWNFVLWGLYFGILIFLEKLFLLRFLEKLPRFVSHVYLLIIAMLGWALFYFDQKNFGADYFAQLQHFLSILFGNVTAENGWWSPQLSLAIWENLNWLLLAFVLCTPVYPYLSRRWEVDLRNNSPTAYFVWVNALQLILLLFAITMLVGNTYNPFIYERF